ncbi:hypothetical protein PYCCODRAFT_915122 [Trametes coccinea BRFM310]|uniref:Uncharacterized protein n=1 Tax=Trametes coccinea (strain BRFM310) TaxID=1353009 RepID=A0A1Y2ICH6_TRAC3|nr:hypothetical protein PYCCODRAFT_915122 [Trametes coccinea BRFM310]
MQFADAPACAHRLPVLRNQAHQESRPGGPGLGRCMIVCGGRYSGARRVRRSPQCPHGRRADGSKCDLPSRLSLRGHAVRRRAGAPCQTCLTRTFIAVRNTSLRRRKCAWRWARPGLCLENRFSRPTKPAQPHRYKHRAEGSNCSCQSSFYRGRRARLRETAGARFDNPLTGTNIEHSEANECVPASQLRLESSGMRERTNDSTWYASVSFALRHFGTSGHRLEEEPHRDFYSAEIGIGSRRLGAVVPLLLTADCCS